jgi:hypothetical protein
MKPTLSLLTVLSIVLPLAVCAPDYRPTFSPWKSWGLFNKNNEPQTGGNFAEFSWCDVPVTPLPGGNFTCPGTTQIINIIEVLLSISDICYGLLCYGMSFFLFLSFFFFLH